MALHHEHPLTLVDMNPKYPHDEVAYDDEEDLILQQAFQHPCDRCDENITYLHRYYYNCDQCDYSVHKSCGELSKTLVHPSHITHTLTLTRVMIHRYCRLCETQFDRKQLSYHCSMCRLYMCLRCAMNAFQYHTIYHPSHQHPLTPISKEILLNCDACGNEHNGVFYQCTTCFLPLIHKDCVFTPKRLLIQKSTYGRFFHTHPLILTYSFPKAEQKAKFYPRCRICKDKFRDEEQLSDNENLWVYKCDKCRYYAHLRCAHLRGKASDSGANVISNIYEDDPNVLHLPLSDQTYNMIKDVVFKETNETSITHTSHEHPLVLVTDDSEPKCNACSITIRNKTTFYKCTDDGCKFVLHDWCTRLPVEIKDYKGHPQHTLLLLPKNDHLGDLKCHVCHDVCDGFAYSCVECNYYIDVLCAFLPAKMTHKSHPYHLLSRRSSSVYDKCGICLGNKYFPDIKGKTWLSCESCDFHLHLGCALLLPETIRHKYDKHPMTLSYSPVENHEGDYFCEVCEEDLNPNAGFYHCYECVQSMHTDCAPLIPPSKAYIGHAPQVPDPLEDWGRGYLRAKFRDPYM